MAKMIDTHVRFPEDTYAVLKDVAKEHDRSIADVVRNAAEYNLQEYLSSVKFVDKEQGDAILHAINNLTEETASLKNEINRIGVNINQSIRGSHRFIDYDLVSMSTSEKSKLPDELLKALQLMQDFKEVVAKESDVLWHILK